MSDLNVPSAHSGSGSYEWVTTFTVRHHAGSPEGAIFQRNAFGKAMEAAGADVVGAVTVPGDAGGEAVRRLMEADDA